MRQSDLLSDDACAKSEAVHAVPVPMAIKRKYPSPIFENAIDSLVIGMEFFRRETSYSSRKHAILTVFHAIELLLKEQLHRTNPILIYKNIDKKIEADSFTVGLADSIARLENTGIEIPKDQKAIVEKIQARRNRIEHHRYDHKAEDETTIAEALKFIFYFVELVLRSRLEDYIDHKLLALMRRQVLAYNELQGFAEFRFNDWAQKKWPKWNREVEDIPEEFGGTLDCPACTHPWLVIGYHPRPFCFYCNVSVDAASCEHCGRTYFVKDGCCSPEEDEAELVEAPSL
jgi:hypothetical protein